ncbi:MAG: hypothetical protein KGH60_04805 [Candidatus Micrarchaeota archaeon]|nr:hypothetical protein [Candidatus Micrarchaeota archaeon]
MLYTDSGNFNVDIKQKEEKEYSDEDAYVTENGERFRVPYRMIKKVIFSNLKKEELIDVPHAARLQYRLMLLDPVIKAIVNFNKQRITVIYNPRTAPNAKEKISQDEIIDILSKQGVHVDKAHIEENDYDYYKDLYTYASLPPSIRERPPYGYTLEEWKKMKPEWTAKMQELTIEKDKKQIEWQQAYLESHPDIAKQIDPNFKPSIVKQSALGKLFSNKKANKKEKGFWFHGV